MCGLLVPAAGWGTPGAFGATRVPVAVFETDSSTSASSNPFT